MKKKYPKISIITPSFNQAEYLEKTIESVLSQNYPNLEYIVIDGGSTDGSLEIIKKYSKKITYWVSEKDRGQSHAINKGFSRATGDIMAWINSDDIYLPGTLKLVAGIFQSCPELSWITSAPSTITPDGYINYMARTPIYVRFFIRNGWHIKSLLGFIMQEGTFWRRELWVKSNAKIDEKSHYIMDMQLWQLFSSYTKLVPISACLAAYRLNPARKNNDNHEKYYSEMNYRLPLVFSFVIKYVWRQIEEISDYLHLTETVYYSEKDESWKYRYGHRKEKKIKLI
jgi:glycosyltransferase involved in cell wall biosynthesis